MRRIATGILASLLFLGNTDVCVYAYENEIQEQSVIHSEQESSDDEGCEYIEDNNNCYEFTEPENVIQDETEYQESIDLLQNGEIVPQHFGDMREPMFVSADENWEIIFKSRIESAMESGEEMVSLVDLGLNRYDNIDTLRLIYRSCIKGNRFYISGSFSYYCDQENNITRLKIGYYSQFYDEDNHPDKEKITSYLSVFDEAACKAIDYAAKGRTPLEQMLLAHDWIVRECDYDYENYLAGSIPNKSYNAYGCLVDGSAVCNGYALAYSYILEELGYESYIAASDAMNHAWNMVFLHGSWFHIDATWDDPVYKTGTTSRQQQNDNYNDEGFIIHDYFLKSDSEIEALGHYRWKLQNSQAEIPIADYDNAYSEAVFSAFSGRSEYILHDQNWYFTDSDKLYRSADLWQTDLVEINEAEYPVIYLHTLGDKFYFTDFSALKCFDPESGSLDSLLISNGTITELSVKKDSVIYVELNGEGFHRYTLNQSELSALQGKTPDEENTWELMDCAALCEASLSLEGQIGVNFIVNISGKMLKDPEAYAELSQEGSSNPPLKVKLADAELVSTTGDRVFRYSVAAKEINDKITIRIYSGDGKQLPLRGKTDRSVELSGNRFSYAAADYINSSKNSSAANGSLMKALSDYGTAAEKYFRYGSIGAAGILADLSAVNQTVLSPYKAVGSGDRIDGVSISASLMLESMTSINVIYAITGSVSDYSFTCDGKNVTPVKVGNEYQVTVPDIAAKDLDQIHEFSITDNSGETQTVKYSALSYAYSKVNNTGDVGTLAKTLYLYNEAAKRYFDA